MAHPITRATCTILLALISVAATADELELRQTKHAERFTPEWPVCAEPSLEFGYQTDPITNEVVFHPGIDFRSAHGLDVRASGPGDVTEIRKRGAYGLSITVDHGGGFTRYAGLSKALVRLGERVQSGQLIARVGTTTTSGEPAIKAARDLLDPAPKASGLSASPHLHFEIWAFDVVRDPLSFFCPRNGCTRHKQTDYRGNEEMQGWPYTQTCKKSEEP